MGVGTRFVGGEKSGIGLKFDEFEVGDILEIFGVESCEGKLIIDGGSGDNSV